MRTGDLLIREYRPADLPEVAEVWHDSWNSTGLYPADRPSLADYRERLASDAGDWTLHVALADGRIGGFVAFQPADHWLRQLFIAPSCQGRGMGQALLNHAKREMPKGFWLRTTAENNPVARRFYERAGLVLREISVHPRFGGLVAIYAWRPLPE